MKWKNPFKVDEGYLADTSFAISLLALLLSFISLLLATR